MVRYLFFILFFAFAAESYGQKERTVDTVTNGAVFHFEEADLYDFGDIKEGVQKVHAFFFTNSGNKPLIITNAMASCGCTTPEWPKEPVLPGKTGKITVTYNSAGHAGEFIKNIFISSNAITPGATSYVLHIKGNVVPRDSK